MKKFIFIAKEFFYLIKRYKAAFLIPILAVLLLLTFLVYYIGPAVITSFIYAGF